MVPHGFVEGMSGIIGVPGDIVKARVSLSNQTLGHLAVLLHVGMVPHGFVEGMSGILQISLSARLVKLSLALLLVEVVNLLSHIGHGVVLLVSQHRQLALVGNMKLLKLLLEPGQLLLAPLVELNLGAGVGPSLLQPGANLLQVPGEDGAILLSLTTVLSLNNDLFLQLINPALQLLQLPASS